MAPMLNFVTALLSAVSDFVAAEPIFYLFGVLLFVFVCKGLRMLMH